MDTKTAVIMPRWIGDYFLALSVAEAKSQTMSGRLELVVPEKLMELHSAVSDLPAVPLSIKSIPQFFATVTSLRKRRFRKMYIIPRSFSSAVLAWASGSAIRRGITWESRQFLLTEILPRTVRSRKHHILNEYATVLEMPFAPPHTWLGKNRKVQKHAEYGDMLVLCPGAQHGPAKMWNGFEELARLCHEQRMVILGGASDRETANAIVAAAPHSAVNLCGQTSLAQAASILAGARLVVSNDSGLMHMAGYLGVPVIGLFGSTQSRWTRPLGKRVCVIQSGVPCPPCFDRTCRYGHYNCMKSITPELVMDAIRSILEGTFKADVQTEPV